MNKINRIVWSDTHQAWVVTHEFAGARGKPSSTRTSALAAVIAALLGTLGSQAQAGGPASPGATALPGGGQVVAGSASIGSQVGNGGARMDIVQSTPRAAIDWQTFDIGAQAQVNFNQPAGGATLNRVLDTNASQIFGKLSSNGQVFLVNPNGMLFAPGAQVDVGGLVASTRNIGTTDFMAGRLTFQGSSSGAIFNQGNITTTAGGTVALIAAKIVNTGSITAPQGQVLMGAGNRVTLDLGGPVKIQVEQGALDALIEQGGAIRADGGLVYLTAKAAGALASAAINQTGSIEAKTLATGEKGEIYLMGDMARGSVKVGGTLKADGGFIETSAATVDVQDGATVQAGHWLIDPTDLTVTAAMAATLQGQLATGTATVQTLASGTGNGDIFVNSGITWSSGNTLTLAAHRNIEINATLDASGGSGGKLALQYGQGAVAAGNTATYTVNAPVLLQNSGAANGTNGSTATNFSTKLGSDGTALNYTVLSSAAALQAMNTSLSGNFALGADISLLGLNWTPIGGDRVFFLGRLDGLGHTVSQLTLTGVSSLGLFGTTSGAAISNLRLKDFDIVSTAGAGSEARAGSLAGYVSNASVLRNVSIQNIRVGSAAGGVDSYGTGTGMLGGLIGRANLGSQLVGITARDVSVTGRRNLGGIAGYISGGSTISNAVVDGLTIGISGYTPGIQSNVGGIVGSILENSPVLSVTRSTVRGLDVTTLSGAYSNGGIGGIVGYTDRGGISDSYAAGSIVANNYTGYKGVFPAFGGVGGLAGYLGGAALSNVYSLVGVKMTGNQDFLSGLGGLVGRSEGSTITNAYATGKVQSTVSGTGATYVGGFIGSATTTTVSGGYWDVDTSGTSRSIGSATTAAGSVAGTAPKPITSMTGTVGATAYTTGTYTGFDFTNTWFMVNGDTRPMLRSEWSPTISNAHQLQLMAMKLAASYTLANDIDLSPALTKASEVWKCIGSDCTSFQGNFVPVGSSNVRFTGSFDGLGHTLSNLVIERPTTDHAGLFGLAFKANISNVGLLRSSVEGKDFVGGLVGYAVGGSISNASYNGNVTGDSDVGGLVGRSYADISGSYSRASVTGRTAVGGLVGNSRYLLTASYSMGSVDGDTSVGGLAGINFGVITDAYSTADVSGSSVVGGLVGTNEGSQILRAFSSGMVMSNGAAGGLVGNGNASTVVDSFWDTSRSGLSSSAGGTGKTTAEMKDPATFAGWSTQIVSDASLSNVYPQLRRFTSGLTAGTSAWVISLPPLTTLTYTLGTASGSSTYKGSAYSLASAWTAGSIFGSSYSSWAVGTDYTFQYNGNTVTGFTNAGTYGSISVNILKTGFALASSGNTAGSLTITPKLLTGSISGGGSVYGQALAAGSVTLSGVIGTDAVSAGSVTVNTTGMTKSGSLNWNAGTYADAQSVGSALSGAKAGNYSFAGATASYSITPAAVSAVTGITAAGKTYDGSNSATLSTASAGFSGSIAGDSLSVATATGAFANANAGTGKAVAVSGITLGGAAAGNYTLASSTAATTADITPKAISAVTGITAANKTYDGGTSTTLDTTGAAFVGKITGDNLAVATASGDFADKHAGNNKTVNVSGITLNGTSAGNYTLANDTATTTASITPKALAVSGITAIDKTYDGSSSASLNTGSASFSGLVGGDTPTLAAATGAFANANAGVGKAVTVSGITLAGAGAGNYTPTSAGTTATINKATLRVNANDFVSSGTATPSVISQSGCVLAVTCVSGISLTGANLGLAFTSGQAASNYSTTLQVGNAAGSLDVNRAISWSGFNLTLSAATDIHINSTLSAAGASDKLSLLYGQGAVAAGNPYTYRFGLTDAGFSGKADLQAGQNFDTRQGSDGTATNWTVVTQLGSATSSNDGTLQGINGTSSLAGNFVLGANIDASATSGWNSGTGWTPIGNATTKFTGRFDGLGHTVSNLTINTSSATTNDNQGLFGYAAGASLANVGVENASVTGSRFMGALVGRGDTTQINQSYARQATMTGERGVGALAGYLTLGSNVNDSFATGETRGNGTADIAYHGGLVGIVEGFDASSGFVAANIRRSFANVNVATTAGSDGSRVAGGLVGLFRGAGSIEDSFALGSVRGRSATTTNGVGGLVGRLGSAGDTSTPTVTRSLASGAVSTTGGTVLGGLVGIVSVGSVNSSLWDTQTTGRSTSAGGSGAVGKTSEQMQTLGTFANAGWDVALTDASSSAGISDFRRAAISLDGSGQWRINPRYITYTLPTIATGSYAYNAQAQTPVEWNSRSILGAAFANWVLGTDYVLTQGGNTLTSVTNAGSYSNIGVTFLRGGAGQYLNASSGNTAGNFTLDKASLVVRANDDARFVTQTDNAGYNGANYSGFVGSDTSAALGGTLAVTRSSSSNAVGSYALTPSGLTAANYSFSYVNGSYQIAAANQMLVKGGTLNSVYGQTPTYSTPVVQYVAGGNVLTLNLASQAGGSFVFAEGSAPGNTVGFTLQASGGSTSSSGWLNAGSYQLTGSAFTASTPNYTGGAGNVVYSGSLLVAPKAVTLGYTASKTYDRTTGFSTAISINGRVAGDNVSLAGSGVFTTNQAGSNLGYTLAATASGSDAGNYVVTGARQSGSTYALNGRDGQIDRKALGISGLAASNKTYDGTTIANFSGTAALTGGVLTGDSLSLTGTAVGQFAGNSVGNGLAVSLSGLALNGTGVTNYLLTVPTGFTANITPRSISAITGITAADKVYDGSTTALLSTGTAGFSGIVAGDSLAVASASGNFSNRNAATGKTVNITGLTLGGTSAGNYTLASNTSSTTATISPATISAVSGLTAANKTYDGSTAATLNTGAAGFTGIVNGDSLSVASATAAFAEKNAGTGKAVNVSGITLGGTHAGNYVLADSSASTTADISAKTLTMTGSTAANKTYDGTTSASISVGTLSGLVGSESLTLSTTGSFANKDAGAGKAVSARYTLADGSNGGKAGNYSLANDSLTANIGQAAATVTANSGSGTYTGLQQSVSGYTVSGLVNGESASVLTGVAASGASATNAGSTTNTASGTASNGNYTLSFVNGALVIGKAQATVTANSGSGTYNGLQQSVSGFTVSGLVNGESASVLGGVTAGVSGTNAGTYASIPSGSDGNYALSFINGALVIDRAPATVTANSGTGTYTGLQQSVSGYTVSGLVNGESASVLSGVTASGASGSNAGSYANTASGTAANGNYLLSFVDGALVIRQAEATVTANSSTVTYNGQQQSVSGYTVSGLVNGESASVLSGISATGATGTNADISMNAALGNADNGNYHLSFVNGTLLINKAEATVTANSGTGTYNGQQQSVSGYTVTGLVNGESASVLDDVSAGGVATNAGTTTILARGSDHNYRLNFVDGTLVISQANATVTANSGTTTYNGQAQSVSGFSVSGLVGGEGASVLSGVEAQGTGTNAGTYTTTASGPTDNGNYNLSFVNGAFVIAKASVAVNAISASNKTYDGSTNATLDLGSASFTGVFGGDTLTVASASGSFADKDVATAKAVTISGITLGGTAAGNYTLASTTASTRADIQRLGSVSWVGGATGNWFDPANWAGGAVPDLSNVAQVEIPANVTVSFNTAGAVAPAQAGQPVNVDNISGANAGLNVLDGRLNVANNLVLAGYAQSGGTVTTGGGFTVSQSFQQSGGLINAVGPVSITQAAGSATLGNIVAGSGLAVHAQGDITQASGSAVTVTGDTTLASATGDVTVTNTGNRFGGAVNISGRHVGQASTGNMTLGNIAASGSLGVQAEGDITQAIGTTVTVTGDATLASATGDVTVTNTGNRFGGAVNTSGRNVDQAGTGNMTLGNIAASGSLGVQAQGDITQAGGSVLSVAGSATLVSTEGSVTINSTGNNFASPPIIRQSGGTGSAAPGTAQASAIASAQQIAANAANAGAAGGAANAGGTGSGLAVGTGLSASGASPAGPGSGEAGTPATGGAQSLSGGLVLVEASGTAGDGTPPTAGAETRPGRDAAGFLRMLVVDGGISLPQGLKAAEPRRPSAPR